MKIPDVSELTEKQRDLYLYAPLDGAIMVSGPPGSGKTLIAYLRGSYTQGKGIPTILTMYNRVLKAYTSNVQEWASDSPPQVTTFYIWFSEYWTQLGISPHEDSLVVLNVPFEEKEEAKAGGARWNRNQWNSFRGKCGAWCTDGKTYNLANSKLRKFKCVHIPPKMDGDYQVNDWLKVQEQIFRCRDETSDENWNWGHLIIDEGQDFPPEMYRSLALIDSIAFQKHEKKAKPRLTVFADQNQRITQNNSLLQEIKSELSLSDERCYSLDDNFRNSRPIAELASYFETDAPTGITTMPSRRGPVPELFEGGSSTSCLDFIKQFVANNPNQEVGVFVHSDRVRKKFFTSLHNFFEETDITIQTYSYSDKKLKAEELVFDNQGTVTVLNHASCKGLEFDTVFIAELQQYPLEEGNLDFFKMNLFVATSRARKRVYLMYTNQGDGTPSFLQHMPDEDFLKRRTL